MSQEKIKELFNIKYPIIQAGMVWVSGGKLASASANSGILGIIGAGSMKPDLLKDHIQKAQNLTSGSLAVNIPLLYSLAQEQIDIALNLGIKIFFTSAGSPKKYTSYLKEKGAIVVHVTSSPELAIKCENAGVDAIVAEGFEAGGHNGRDELTTMTLIPLVSQAVSIPVIAAGGIADGRSMAAAICLGASAVQIGTRFVATKESSAHINFKNRLLSSKAGETKLMMKNLVPVRLLHNQFSKEVALAEQRCANADELKELLGKGRAKKGMLEGDIEHGELEIGQCHALIKDIPTAHELVQRIIKEYNQTLTLQPL